MILMPTTTKLYRTSREGELPAEREISALAGTPGCVFVGGERSGLRLALLACGVSDGDGVLCPALGGAVIPAAIADIGAVPLFADINPNTLNIDPFCLEYAVKKLIREKSPIPKALITQDIFGMPCNYRDIVPFCEKHGIALIEYMGGALGASDGDVRAGSAGRFAITSFCDLSPVLRSEDDCAVLCGIPGDDILLRSLRDSGRTSGGWSGRETQRLLTLEFAKRALGDSGRRRVVADWYASNLKSGVRIQEAVRADSVSARTRFVIMPETAKKRLAVSEALTAGHIPHAVFYPGALHRKNTGGGRREILINAERAEDRLIALPMHPYLSKGAVAHICGLVLGCC